MIRLPRRVLTEHHAFVASDNPFQAEARLLQALWRETEGLPIGEHRGEPLGSRLAMPGAEALLSNYVTENIRSVVRREVLDQAQARGKLFGRPRIFNDLLSSQPLCFNIFGELSLDLDLASRAFARLTGGRVATVTAIDFEHSPGRGDAKYTGDRSAFDVFVQFRTASGKKGFVGIEVKYHEALGDSPAPHRVRYDELAALMGAFDPAAASSRLQEKPLQQIWRDHLLAGSLLATDEFEDGFFVFLYPERNVACEAAIREYRSCLVSEDTFDAWTLEQFMAAVLEAGGGRWAGTVVERYLNFAKLDALRGND
jgi:hypothetical protein